MESQIIFHHYVLTRYTKRGKYKFGAFVCSIVARKQLDDLKEFFLLLEHYYHPYHVILRTYGTIILSF